MKSIRLLLSVFLASLCLSGAVTADAVAPGPEQEIFFSQFRTAVAGEDARKLIGLTHPQARQCTKEDDQEQYYGLIMKGLVQMLGRQQTITEISSKKVEPQDIQKSVDTAAQSSMKWPVTPEEQLTIRYDIEGSESSATLYIARDQDQWKWVHLCYQ